MELSPLHWDETQSEEEGMRDFAATYRLERRESVSFEGECAPCAEQYRANCALLGIRP